MEERVPHESAVMLTISTCFGLLVVALLIKILSRLSGLSTSTPVNFSDCVVAITSPRSSSHNDGKFKFCNFDSNRRFRLMMFADSSTPAGLE